MILHRRRLWFVVLVGLVLAGLVLAGGMWVAADVFARVAWHKVEISDLNKPETILLSSRRINAVYAIELSIQGEIDGEIEIGVDNQQPQRLSGKVNWSATHDWYEHECQLNYRPIGNASGNLKIWYRFQELYLP